MVDSQQIQKVIILGAGPAGLAAALYAARANLEPLVLAGMYLGGQASLTHMIENYPGFPKGISGGDLTNAFSEQAERFGARIEFETATRVDIKSHPFRVITDEQEYATQSLIIATGAASRQLNVPGENEFTGLGVSYCATCDGHFFRGKNVIVVGGGDSAVEEALFLTRYASKVTLVHRRNELRAGALLQKRAIDNPKMDFIWDSTVSQIYGEKDMVKGVKLHNVKTGVQQDMAIDGVFIFIGHTPNTEIFKGQLEIDANGYLVINRSMQTSAAGVFAAGEAADSTYRQVVTSAGEGASAAMQAIRYLDEHY
jgi:thioredoxin reductase (NADPH)